MSETREELEQRLRDSLQARAQDVEATPALWQEVGGRVRRRRLVTRLGAVVAAVAAVAALAIVVPPLLTTDRGPVITQPPADPTIDPDVAPGPTTPPDTNGDPTTPDVVELRPVTVFFVRATETDLWVEPETHYIPPETAAVARAAMELLIAGETRSPELTTQAPVTSEVLATNIRDGVLIVDLSSGVLEGGHGSAQELAFAQQLAHTAAAFDGIGAVQLYVEGAPIDELWGHLDWSQPIEPDPFALAPIVIEEPGYGDLVAAGEVTFSGHALVMFEATFTIRLYAPDGSLSHEDFVMTADAFERGPWAYTHAITEPGTWRLVAEEQDPSGGEGRAPLTTSITFEVVETVEVEPES